MRLNNCCSSEKNARRSKTCGRPERIRLSDGGVSELLDASDAYRAGAYQAFRWWGIGTRVFAHARPGESVSGFPMVGYRNTLQGMVFGLVERIRLSDGGVSELCRG